MCSAPPNPTRTRWRSTCSRESARWRRATSRSAASASPASRRRRAVCLRCRCPSTSMPMVCCKWPPPIAPRAASRAFRSRAAPTSARRRSIDCCWKPSRRRQRIGASAPRSTDATGPRPLCRKRNGACGMRPSNSAPMGPNGSSARWNLPCGMCRICSAPTTPPNSNWP